MTFGRWVLQSLRYYWRTQLGVMLGCVVASATLVGALVLGDSVRHSLRQQALSRIGQVDVAVHSFDRFFEDRLGADLRAASEAAGSPRVFTPTLVLRGVGKNPETEVLATSVQVLGIDDDFFALSPGGAAQTAPPRGEVDLNHSLATQLGVGVGDEVVLRIEKPSALPRDQTFSLSEDVVVSLPSTVRRLVDRDGFGHFGLHAGAGVPYSAFVSRAWLQERVERPGRANLLLSAPEEGAAASDAVDVQGWIAEAWTLADAELEVRAVPDRPVAELISDRIFLDPGVGEAAAELGLEVVGLLSYFVNTLAHGERETPYSTVGAVGLLSPPRDGEPTWRAWAPIPDASLPEGELILTDWLAEDLQAGPGDSLRLDYFVVGGGGGLREQSSTFRVRGVSEIAGVLADRELMPDFPGLADKKDCSDWDPGIPVDLDRIRDVDETYWDEHEGTPKAYVSLEQGQALWQNRFGNLTSLRVRAEDAEALATGLRQRLRPQSFALEARGIREAALAGANPATDFGVLFLSLGFFLIAAALLLSTLLFALGVEQRAAQIGLLLAVGYRKVRVRLLLLSEAAAVAVVGGLIGVPFGLLYTDAVLAGLGGTWSGAVADTPIALHVRWSTLLAGAALAALAAAATIGWSLRKEAARPAAELLRVRGGVLSEVKPAGWLARGLCGLGLVGAIVLGLTAPDSGPQRAGVFFGSGSLLLIAGLSGLRVQLGRMGGMGGRRAESLPSILALAWRGLVRRPGRSLATVALLASGAFLVMAVGVHRQAPPDDPTDRASGTGGFTLFASSSLPVVVDLDDPEDRLEIGLFDEGLEDVSFVPLRVRDGDEASCLNLGKAQNPQLVGVDAGLLDARGAFSFAATSHDVEGATPWRLLEHDFGDEAVPAIGDDASVTWALQKSVGDTLDYVDERGEPFQVRIVGTVQNSILQGKLLIAEGRFEELFPSEPGHRNFLIDAPPERATALKEKLSDELQDLGFEVGLASVRLEGFNEVQNTYLSIFQTLGALGLLIGSAGVGVVVLRNVLERRGELAVARAVGFRRRTVRAWIWQEHSVLLAAGLGLGSVAAFLAVLPTLGDRSSEAARTALWVFGALTASGLVWVALATVWAARGRLLADLSSPD